jgi:hypothetical protein
MARIASLPKRAPMLVMLVSCFTYHEKPQPQAHLMMLKAIILWLQDFNGKKKNGLLVSISTFS